MDRSDVAQLNDFTWELPASAHADMRVPVRFLANEALLERILRGPMVQQIIDTASLPGLVGHLVVMPDVSPGKGAPVGIVAVSKYPVGAIAPAAVGRDINTGVRLLGSSIRLSDIEDNLDGFYDALCDTIPCGNDAEGSLHLNKSEVDHVAQSGAQWALRNDMARQDDLVRAEEGGRLNEAKPDKVSAAARDAGARQLGTLGSGAHFIEVGVVEEVYNRAAGLTMGLRKGRLTVLIHCGSRGYGRQVCDDYIARFQEAGPSYDATPPSPDLAFVPLDAPEAEDYIGAMRAAANYAYANRQVLAHRVREAADDALGGIGDRLRTVYDVAHTLGHVEMHQIEDRHVRCYVHRKGAARAFGPGTPGISLPYRALGQPVIVPGERNDTSYVMLATRDSMQKSYGSACHGAGRTISEQEVPSELPLTDNDGGVQTKEAVGQVVDTVVGAGLASKVARIRPLSVVNS